MMAPFFSLNLYFSILQFCVLREQHDIQKLKIEYNYKGLLSQLFIYSLVGCPLKIVASPRNLRPKLTHLRGQIIFENDGGLRRIQYMNAVKNSQSIWCAIEYIMAILFRLNLINLCAVRDLNLLRKHAYNSYYIDCWQMQKVKAKSIAEQFLKQKRKGSKDHEIPLSLPQAASIRDARQMHGQEEEMDSESQREAEELFKNLAAIDQKQQSSKKEEDVFVIQNKFKSILAGGAAHKPKPKSVTFVADDQLITDMAFTRKWKDPINYQKKGKFSPQQQRILSVTISQFLVMNDISYDDFLKSFTMAEAEKSIRRKQKFFVMLASALPNRSPQSCYKYVKRNFNTFNHSGEWTKEETDRLIELVEKYGRKWKLISKELKRSSDNIYDKYRSLGEENLEERSKDLWKFSELISLLTEVQKQAQVEFIDQDIKKEIANADYHDQREKEQYLSKRYNSKSFIFHNIEVLRKYVRGRLFQAINIEKIRWSKISNKLVTRSSFDCRNKIIQLLQVFIRTSISRDFDREIIAFLSRQMVSQDSQVDWRQWKSKEYTVEQAKNRYMIMKKSVEGRSSKPFEIVLQQLQKKLGKAEPKQEK